MRHGLCKSCINTEGKEGTNMKTFDYIIVDDLGLHARPATMLVREIKNYESKITLNTDGKTVDATKLLAVMGLGAKKGTKLMVTAEGPDEDRAIHEMEKFFTLNL